MHIIHSVFLEKVHISSNIKTTKKKLIKQKIQCFSQVETKSFDVSYLLFSQHSFPWKFQNSDFGFGFRTLISLKRLQYTGKKSLSAARERNCNVGKEYSNTHSRRHSWVRKLWRQEWHFTEAWTFSWTLTLTVSVWASPLLWNEICNLQSVMKILKEKKITQSWKK